jgi:selenocysteine lyase/cysteine desulfurase
LSPLLQAAQNKGLKIIWIPVSYCSYQHTAIANYQAALDPSTPLASLTQAELDKALVKIAAEIRDESIVE